MVEDVVAVETADAVEDEAAVALETVGAAAAEVVEEVLAAMLTGAVGASFLAQAAAKHTTTAITAIRINDEASMDMVLILLKYFYTKYFSNNDQLIKTGIFV